MKKKGDFNFKGLEKKLKALEKTLPTIIGNEAVATFQMNFAAGGFIDNSREKWEQKKDGQDSHLIKSGALRRDIKLKTATMRRIMIATSLPYAAIHNFGGKINKAARTGEISFKRGKGGKLKMGKTRTELQQRKIVTVRRSQIGAHDIEMPKREFIGHSAYLDKKILLIIQNKLAKMFQSK